MAINLTKKDAGRKEKISVPEPYDISLSRFYHKPYYYHPHWHDFMELILLKKGSQQVMLRNTRFQMKEGELLVVMPGELHSYEFDGKEALEFWCLTYDSRIFQNAFFDPDEISLVYSCFTNYQAPRFYVCDPHEVKKAKIQPLMENILLEKTKKNPGFNIAIKTDLAKITLWLLRYLNRNNLSELEAGNIALHTKMSKVFDIIQKQFQTNILTAEMADMMAMSRSHFCSLFKKITGCGFRKYLQSQRIIEAVKLLLSTENNVSQVAALVGYDDVNFFIRAFRKQIGMSPLQYKKKFLNVPQNQD